jgi:hypothetical protein
MTPRQSGDELDPALRRAVAEKFSYEFSRVRVLSDAAAAADLSAEQAPGSSSPWIASRGAPPRATTGPASYTNGAPALSVPGDRLEREADRLADEVAVGPSATRKQTGFSLDRAAPEAGVAGIGEGQPLNDATRDRMEQVLGVDLRGTRIHIDDRAAAAARAVGAKAFTIGRNVYFDTGNYAPETTNGCRTLAHELVHVAQQSGGGGRVSQSASATLSRIPSEEGIRAGRYSYSTNCAWIDWGHADGAAAGRLINDVRRASASMAAKRTSVPIGPLQTEHVVSTQESKARKKLLGMDTGNIVIHQAMLGVEVLKPLTPDQELSVALGIFQFTGEIFETLQASTDRIARSSFSEEDLPSNTIGFYRAARGWSRPDIELKAGAQTIPSSLSQLRGYTFGEERTHQATRLPSGGRWPADFTTIKPEPPGVLWQNHFLQTIEAGIVKNYAGPDLKQI